MPSPLSRPTCPLGRRQEGIKRLHYEPPARREGRHRGDRHTGRLIVVTAIWACSRVDEENGSDSAQKTGRQQPEIDVLQVAQHLVVNESRATGTSMARGNVGRDSAASI